MSDPLSVAASVVGLISLGIQVTQSLIDFYLVYKRQKSEIVSTTEKLEGLISIFKSLERSLSSRKFQAEEGSLIDRIETSIKNCNEVIQELLTEYQKFSSTPNGIKTALSVTGRRATYPFRQSTLQKLDEDIDALRENLSIALSVLQLSDTQKIQDDITNSKNILDLVRANQISVDIRNWLKAPDATVNHNAACAKRYGGTGEWLVKSSAFETWLTEDNSFLWLNGFAGCGKSVLCSTAVLHAFRHRKSNPHIGIAFFYFTFNDNSKQDQSAMLRALLVQLSSQLRDDDSDLTRLYNLYKPGIPPSPVLAAYLQRLIHRFQHTYIMLDALDESPRNGAQEDVLKVIEMMQKWSLLGLHLFVTSRDEPGIRGSLDASQNQEVQMKNDEINKDITDFVSGQLHEDRRLRKWSPYRDKIQETLAQRAQGV